MRAQSRRRHSNLLVLPRSDPLGEAQLTGGDFEPAASVASYIGDMVRQLTDMAEAAGLDLAAYFLKMAQAECEATVAEAARSRQAQTG